MNTEMNIYNWKFYVVVRRQEAIRQFQSTLSQSDEAFKHDLMHMGTYVKAAHRKLENQVFLNESNGRLVGGEHSETQIRDVEIDLFDGFDNFRSFGLLAALMESEMDPVARNLRKNEAACISGFRVHGHEMDKPSVIHVLGYDKHGFYFVDMRRSLETVKILEEHPLP